MLTVTSQPATYFLPSAVVAVTVIRHDPVLRPVTSPFEDTTATASLLELHLRLYSSVGSAFPSAPKTRAESVIFLFSKSSASVCESLTPAAGF